MSDTCETVQVVSGEHEAGFKIINKADFKEGEHTIYAAPEQKEEVAEEVKPGRSRKQ